MKKPPHSSLFELKPFPGAIPLRSPQSQYTVSASVHLREERCELRFRVEARSPEARAALQLTSPANSGSRKDGLWKTTCFEAFFKNPHQPGYLEWNAHRNGDWNLYAFDDYRKGMREVVAASEPLIFLDKTEGDTFEIGFSISRQILELELGEAPWNVSLTMVIEAPLNEVHYWALAHCGKEPDFHLPESFLLSIGRV